MATVGNVTTAESGKAAAPPAPAGGGRGFPGAELALRALLFAVTLAALVLLPTAKQTVLVPVPVLRAVVPMVAKFNHSPALIYLLVALCVTCLYSLLTALGSLRLIWGSASARTLFILLLLDVVEIWANNKIHREERTFIGKWDIQDIVSSSPHLCGPEKSSSMSEKTRHVKFHFPNPIRCRIVSIKMTLPHIGSRSNKFSEEFDLLSLGDNSFYESKPTNPHNSFIHAKRIIVFGSSLRKEMEPDTSGGIMRMKSYLDRSPPWGRFRIPVEAERLRDNDLVLEQYLLPSSPGIAGFRLDFFSVIRPRVTHSPSSSEMDTREFSLTRLEDRYVNQAILYMQVTIVKESGKVVVEEYRLPEVKANTPLYFDFPDPQQDVSCVIFRLLGDVTAFVDDISELDGLNFRNLPLASGLSLSNKIKLYYYADTYEMGKIGSFSAV